MMETVRFLFAVSHCLLACPPAAAVANIGDKQHRTGSEGKWDRDRKLNKVLSWAAEEEEEEDGKDDDCLSWNWSIDYIGLKETGDDDDKYCMEAGKQASGGSLECEKVWE